VRYPISFWHYGNYIDENIPRTNNAIEGWNSTFKNTFGTSRYSLHLLIEKLKCEEDAIRIKAIRQENGDIIRRKRKFIRIEQQINDFLRNNNERNFGVVFVLGLVQYLTYE
jgi:hypothetical protein